ncbi:hypothetical protein JCM8097_003726, partial [Rhodosporidiobolus ruineniae]
APTTLEMLLELRHHAPHLLSDPNFAIIIDGGIRRGTDVVAALCLGATAVSLGRPFMYSLIYGAEGVAKVIGVLEEEVVRACQLLGVTKLSELGPHLVNTRRVERKLYGVQEKL